MLLQSSSRLTTNTTNRTSAKLLLLMFSSACQRSSLQRSLLLPSSSFPPLSFQSSSIHTTAINQAEPLRKKKVINPLTTKKQFDRKVRRLEREINRLESIPPKLKPILELQLPPHVVKNLDQYQRKFNEDEQNDIDNFKKLLKQYYKIWSIYKNLETKEEMNWIHSVVKSQQEAMNLLKNEYPNLYKKAIEIDPKLIPYRIDNVKKNTPPNDQYQCPDGIETDITKEWKL